MRGMGMPVIDNVALQGTSPNLTMSYNLALYIIPRNPPPQSDPRLTGQPTAAPAGGAGAAAGAAGYGGSINVPSSTAPPAPGGGKLGGGPGARLD
jgi:hypothetical protein